ncbi:MAG: sulfotransferase [Pseudomonadota bacterium]|nr:sulfotransferase [Pseudomonadota bacterium]
MKNNHKINILFIASPGRSGSTLMERVLNEFSETSAIGELGRRKELTKKNICLCGNRFETCPQWQKIINDPKFKEINQEYLSLSKKYMDTSFFIKLLLRSKIDKEFQIYLQNLELLYHIIYKNRESNIIVDSTTHPIYGYYLSLIPSINVQIIHLIRDPRGVVYSMSKVKFNKNNIAWSPSISPIKSAFMWLKRNFFIEFFLRKKKRKFLRINYEDFVTQPKVVFEKISNNFKLDLKQLNIQNNKIRLKQAHLCGGNIDGFKKGDEEISLKLDDRWKREMKLKHIVLTTLITLPLLIFYRYLRHSK